MNNGTNTAGLYLLHPHNVPYYCWRSQRILSVKVGDLFFVPFSYFVSSYFHGWSHQTIINLTSKRRMLHLIMGRVCKTKWKQESLRNFTANGSSTISIGPIWNEQPAVLQQEEIVEENEIGLKLAYHQISYTRQLFTGRCLHFRLPSYY